LIERTHDGIGFLTFESFDEHGTLSALVTSRHGGVSAGPYATLNLGRRGDDDPAAVATNRERVASLLSEPATHLTFGRQVHSARVSVVTAVDRGRAFDDTDALITNAADTPLVILTADCAAVFLFDPVHHAIGVAHAGWRGTVARIAGATVSAMRETFGSLPVDLHAAVGPCIGPCCYEVGENVIEAAQETFAGDTGDVLIEPDMASAGSFRASVNEDRKHFDLWRANERVLMDAGVAESRIEIAGLCTACRTDLFYSHRAENGSTGRFGALAMLHGSKRRIY
jgi:YfiH family protein